MSSFYRSSPIKRSRRTKADMTAIRDGLSAIVAAAAPMTVRQVFYQAVSRGLVPKTEAAYKHTVGRLLTEMRRDGTLPFEWIADNSRWMRKPRSDVSLNGFVTRVQQDYRRNLWESQEAYVEVWIEKEALAGVLYEVTAQWDVPLMVTRGYPSLSFLHEAALDVPKDKDCHLYYFGDRDPSGVDIPRFVEDSLREFGADLRFERVAVTAEQVKRYRLPTRPTKQSDSRARRFRGASVELDALPSQILRDLVERCITQHLDRDELARTRAIEAAERESLEGFTRRWQKRGLPKLREKLRELEDGAA